MTDSTQHGLEQLAAEVKRIVGILETTVIHISLLQDRVAQLERGGKR